MPPITRRSLAAGAAALPLFAIRNRPAGAAEFTYKFANNLPAAHPMNIRANEGVARVLEATGGRVEIKVFPNNQLGSDTDMLSQLRSGAVEFFTLSGLILSTLVPPASINGVGFAFKNYDQVWARDGREARRFCANRDCQAWHPTPFDRISSIMGFARRRVVREADPLRRRTLKRPQDPGAGQPTMDEYVRRHWVLHRPASTSPRFTHHCRPTSSMGKRTR